MGVKVHLLHTWHSFLIVSILPERPLALAEAVVQHIDGSRHEHNRHTNDRADNRDRQQEAADKDDEPDKQTYDHVKQRYIRCAVK